MTDAERNETASALVAALAAAGPVERTVEQQLTWRGIARQIADLEACCVDALQRRETLREINRSGDLDEELTEVGQEIAVAETELRRYLELEVRKVDNVARFLDYLADQHSEARALRQRLQARERLWEARLERLKRVVVEVMGTLSEKRLESATNVLRVQTNPASVEITTVAKVPDEYITRTVSCDVATWRLLLELAMEEAANRGITPDSILARIRQSQPDDFRRAEIATAIKANPCKDCKGAGGPVDLTEYGGAANEPCPTCDGTGTTIPGVRLVCGQHLRVE